MRIRIIVGGRERMKLRGRAREGGRRGSWRRGGLWRIHSLRSRKFKPIKFKILEVK